MSFGENLLLLRKSKGLSQEGLGNIINVSRQTISKWELEETTPEMDRVIQLSDYFGITLDELINGKKKTKIESEDISDKVVKESKSKIIDIIIKLVIILVSIFVIMCLVDFIIMIIFLIKNGFAK